MYTLFYPAPNFAWTKVNEKKQYYAQKAFFLPTIQIEEIFNKILQTVDTNRQYSMEFGNIVVFYSILWS
jgi:hypothetical protein